MKPSISFLYPSRRTDDAVACTWRLYRRHSTLFDVRWDQSIETSIESDTVIVVTNCSMYSRESIDRDISYLSRIRKPFLVLHHNDHGQPTPGRYKSVCWTKTAAQKLSAYSPTIVRQPSFAPVFEPHSGPLLVGTFGICEEKKQTKQMYRRMRDLGVSFVAYSPAIYLDEHGRYQDELRREGCRVETYSWVPMLEQCDWLLKCSHFIFVLLGPMKTGPTGGSSMSPRHATLFNRPVLVVDDEDTYAKDGFYVYHDLGAISKGDLTNMVSPSGWYVDDYVRRLVSLSTSDKVVTT